MRVRWFSFKRRWAENAAPSNSRASRRCSHFNADWSDPTPDIRRVDASKQCSEAREAAAQRSDGREGMQSPPCPSALPVSIARTLSRGWIPVTPVALLPCRLAFKPLFPLIHYPYVSRVALKMPLPRIKYCPELFSNKRSNATAAFCLLWVFLKEISKEKAACWNHSPISHCPFSLWRFSSFCY